MITLLIVDDESTARRLLYHALKSDYRVLEAADGTAALGCVERERVDLVILDLHLPPRPESAAEGIRVHAQLREAAPRLPVVITTGDVDRQLALDMVRRGVADFLLKPIDPTVLKIVVERALERARLESELESLREQMRERFSLGGLIGQSPAMRTLFGTLEKLAGSSITVLLLGESGTGKSFVAKTLHYGGPRSRNPFVVVDGATIPEALIESELFGHVRGAYTGAEAAKSGRIQMADGGTLFMDEIGNLSLAAQGKLLLFLDSHAFTPVGSTQEIRVDVRLIAATNRDLERMVEEGTFRQDLLYRLQVATVTLPPLRVRHGDIALLAGLFLASLARQTEREAPRLTAEAVRLLESYSWPGNVRQLRHVLESSLVLSKGDMLDVGDLVLPAARSGERAAPATATDAGAPTHVERAAPGPDVEAPSRTGDVSGRAGLGSLKENVAAFERDLLRKALALSGGNKAAAGRLLQLDENQIHYLCRKHGLG